MFAKDMRYAFGVGRRFTNPRSDAITVGIVEESDSYIGFGIVGPDSRFFNNEIMDGEGKWYENLSFYAGCLSHPVNVARFFRDYLRDNV